MMHRILAASAIASAFLLGPVQAIAGNAQTCRSARVALVIGNAGYAGVPDGGERQSAKLVASELDHLGFATVLAQDLDGKNLRGAVATFVRRVAPDAVVFLFFAGVAVQAGGHGYLLPTDAAVSAEADVEKAGINIDRIVSDLTARGARVKVVVIDGARRNLLEDRFRPGAPKGLPPLAGSAGTLALYSSLPGTAYEDDPDRRDAFAQALASAMDAPDAMAEEAIRHAKAVAERAFQGSRTPWVSSFLDEDVALSSKGCVPARPAETSAASDPAPAPPPPAPARPITPVPTAAAPHLTAPPVVTAPTPVEAAAAAQASEPSPPASPPGPLRPDAQAAPEPSTPEPVSTTNRHDDASLEQPPTPPASPAPAPAVAATAPAATTVSPQTAAVEPPVDDMVTDPDHLQEIADRLYDQGFDPGPPSASGLGLAIGAFQRRAMLTSDGRASVKLLKRLRDTPPPSRWGAIAFGPKIGKWGAAWATRTRREAVAQAGARCAATGCTAIASFHDDGCGALAISPRSFAIAWQDGVQQARDDATGKCGQQGSGCHVLASVCADGSGQTQVLTNDQQAR